MFDHPGLDRLKGHGWRFHHLGVVVRDLDKALEKYRALGLGSDVPKPRIMEGRSAGLRGVMVNIGPLAMEMWQPLRGNTIQQEFLDRVGEQLSSIRSPRR
jgi:hypothetical protein